MSAHGIVDRARRSYRASLQSVRALLVQFGTSSEVSGEALEACRADLLAVKAAARRHGAPGSPLEGMFRLSDEVEMLIRRLGIAEHPAPRVAAAGARHRTSDAVR